MPATQTATTPLADLTCPELSKAPYIESGRLKWEAKRAGDIIRMFAVGGYDVRKDVGHDGKEIDGCWGVYDQQGHFLASILSHRDVPNFAYAFTTLV